MAEDFATMLANSAKASPHAAVHVRKAGESPAEGFVARCGCAWQSDVLSTSEEAADAAREHRDGSVDGT